MFVLEIRRQEARGQMLVAFETAALGTVGRKAGDVDAYRYTGLALLAVWAVSELPAAAKSCADQRTVSLGDRSGG